MVIDITGSTPMVTPTNSHVVAAPPRQRHRAGRRQGAGHRRQRRSGNQLTGVNNIAEIWNPQTGQWTQGAEGTNARLYHCNALLLPDASVLVAGGGARSRGLRTAEQPERRDLLPAVPVHVIRRRARHGPASWPRPTGSTSARRSRVDTAGAASISRVTLVKTGSVTHSLNMEQRFMDLTFSANGTQLAVQAPTRAADAPPGFYMMFVLEREPACLRSRRSCRIGIAANPNPAVTPTLATPAARTGTRRRADSLQLSASDPNGDTLTYGANGAAARA